MLFSAAFVILFAAGCESKKEDAAKTPPPVDSTAIKDSIKKAEEAAFKITYHYYPETGRTRFAALKEEFTPEQLKIILAVNRLDAKNFGSRDSVVVPDTFVTDYLRYSPFPREVKIADSVKKLIIFAYDIESYAAYEQGKLVRWGPTSMGKKSKQTPTGLLHTNWKAKETISTFNDEWKLPWAFNLDNFEGVSMHQYDLPGYPASHACCRLWEEDAEWFYYWAEQWILTPDGENVVGYGTPVIIYGKYNFGHKPPWHYLPQNADTTTVPEQSLASEIQPYIDTILQRQKDREYNKAVLEKQKEEKERLKQEEAEKKQEKMKKKPEQVKKKDLAKQ